MSSKRNSQCNQIDNKLQHPFKICNHINSDVQHPFEKIILSEEKIILREHKKTRQTITKSNIKYNWSINNILPGNS